MKELKTYFLGKATILSKRWKVWAIFLLVFTFMASSCYQSKRDLIKNLIIITLDTTRADHIGCYGYDEAETPNLDRFASEAIIFENAVCHSPTTIPSHLTIMTGLYPPAHGVRVTGGQVFSGKVETLAEILKKNDYRTAAVVSGYPLIKSFGLDKGFDYYEDSFWKKIQNILILERKADESIHIALKWIQDNKDSKFFLFLHLWDPHAEYLPPPPFDASFADRPYDGEIAYMDRCLGHFFQKLKEWNIYSSSMIIIAGDHGEGLGDHGESEHQYFLYDSTIRVPFLIRVPGNDSRKDIQGDVGLADIFPTALDYLNLKGDNSVDGLSLKPLIDGSQKKQWNRSLYMETLSGEIALGWSPMYAIRKGGWKFIEAPLPELYDLEADPHERINLASKEIQKMEDLKRELEEMMSNLEKTEKLPEEMDDEETLRKLASLGYVSSGSFSRKRSISKDPKQFIKIEKDVNILGRLFSEKRLDESFPYINRILNLDPENKLALFYAGVAYYEKTQYNEAIPYLEKLITFYPDHEDGSEFLIRIYSSKKQWDKAMDLCNRSISYFPDEHKFHAYKGLIFANLDKCSEAIRSYEEAIRLEENLPDVYYYLARCYAITGQEDLSIHSIELSLQKGVQNPRVYLIDPVFSRMQKFWKVKDLLASYGII